MKALVEHILMVLFVLLLKRVHFVFLYSFCIFVLFCFCRKSLFKLDWETNFNNGPVSPNYSFCRYHCSFPCSCSRFFSLLNLFYSECGSFCQNCTSMFTCNRCKSGFYKMKSSITRMERCTRRCPYGYKNETGGGVCTKGWSAMFESHYITSHHITSHHITSHRIASHHTTPCGSHHNSTHYGQVEVKTETKSEK